MKVSRLSALTAFLIAAATPAVAAWDNIGSVDVNHGRDWDIRRFDLGGPVERLRLRASDSAVDCRSINASFANGGMRRIFSGRLRLGLDRTIDLPGNQRRITRLSFQCSAAQRRGATIRISADVGRYRDDWRRSPDWQRTWARLFNWGSNAVNDWQYLGSESFNGRDDRERTYAGWQGRRIDALALKPSGDDARCARVAAEFGNGQTRVLASDAFLSQGEYHKLDIPGDVRNLSNLRMHCAAAHGRNVTIRIYTSN